MAPVFRQRRPRVVLGVTVAATVLSFMAGPGHGPTAFIVMIAMYTVAVREDGDASLVTAALVVALLDVGNVLFADGTGVDTNSLLNLVAVGLAFALGDAVRGRGSQTPGRHRPTGRPCGRALNTSRA